MSYAPTSAGYEDAPLEQMVTMECHARIERVRSYTLNAIRQAILPQMKGYRQPDARSVRVPGLHMEELTRAYLRMYEEDAEFREGLDHWDASRFISGIFYALCDTDEIIRYELPFFLHRAHDVSKDRVIDVYTPGTDFVGIDKSLIITHSQAGRYSQSDGLVVVNLEVPWESGFPALMNGIVIDDVAQFPNTFPAYISPDLYRTGSRASSIHIHLPTHKLIGLDVDGVQWSSFDHNSGLQEYLDTLLHYCRDDPAGIIPAYGTNAASEIAKTITRFAFPQWEMRERSSNSQVRL